MSGLPDLTIAISTRDRKDELRRVLSSVRLQQGSHEVLVMDDGSRDGTAEMVEREFPEVRLHRSERSVGQVIQRNRAARLARAPLVMVLDDDAEMISPLSAKATVGDFADPRVGAVALPFVDVLYGDDVKYAAPDDDVYVTYSFTAAAAAFRRDPFLRVGGFRACLGSGHWEEPDLCLRLLDAGYVTRVGTAEPLRHYESPLRDEERNSQLAHRNDVLVACLTAPAASLPRHLAELTAGRRPIPFLSRTMAGYRAAFRHRRERRPVAPKVFRLRRRLWKEGPKRLREVEHLLPLA